MTRNKSKPRPSLLDFPYLHAAYLEEPSLQFGCRREHVDPKTGITLFGPRSIDLFQRHPEVVKVGLIGSGQSLGSAQQWLNSCVVGVEGEGDDIRFPGCMEDRGFFTRIVTDDAWVEPITQHELSSVARPHLRKERFNIALNMISDKLRLLSQKDRPPGYIILALPDKLLEHCRTVEYKDTELGDVHQDFRRAIKAEAMKYRIPTQILLQKVTEALPKAKNVDSKSECAWNVFTGLYFKAGGIPWSPTGFAPGTCYIGISFFRPVGWRRTNTVRTSIAQAFDEHGGGLVLRGQDFVWDEQKFGRSPHLSEEQSAELIQMVLRRYQDEMKQTPSRVVVHKSSRFWPAERSGLEQALAGVSRFDFVSVQQTSAIRLLRAGQYPPLRGTSFSVGQHYFLYTTGFIFALNAYPHGHVPSPLQVTDHIGDSPIETILKEILVLTKMNWNSAAFAGVAPITLRFSRLVGDIMREIPPDREPLPQFKYYM